MYSTTAICGFLPVDLGSLLCEMRVARFRQRMHAQLTAATTRRAYTARLEIGTGREADAPRHGSSAGRGDWDGDGFSRLLRKCDLRGRGDRIAAPSHAVLRSDRIAALLDRAESLLFSRGLLVKVALFQD